MHKIAKTRPQITPVATVAVFPIAATVLLVADTEV
jgi:hypothetical protein